MPKVGMEPIRRKQIINAVISCIAEVGVDKVTLGMIAANAKFSKGVLLYYFENREDLLLKSCEALYNEYFEVAAANIGEIKCAREALEKVAETSMDILQTHKEENEDFLIDVSAEVTSKVIVQMYSKMATDKAYKEILGNVYKRYLNYTKKILEVGIENNEFSVDSVESAAYKFMAFLEGLALYDILGIGPTKVDKKSIWKSYIDNNFI